MTFKNIIKSLEDLELPPLGALNVKGVFTELSSYKIGFNSDGKLIFLIQPEAFPEEQKYVNYNGNNLDIILDFQGTVNDKQSPKEKYICLILESNNALIKETFISMCVSIYQYFGDNPSYSSLVDYLHSFKNLFIKFNQKPSKSEVGLFGELLIINESKNPDKLVEGWHITGKEIFDFTLNSNQLEIKTTTLNSRIHKIKHSQHKRLREMSNGFISSIMLMESDNGINVSKVAEEIRKKLDHEATQLFNQKLASCVGDSFEDYNTDFNYKYSLDSIKFYKAIELQSLNDKDIPENIADIKYSLNLEASDEISTDDLASYFNLILR